MIESFSFFNILGGSGGGQGITAQDSTNVAAPLLNCFAAGEETMEVKCQSAGWI